MTSYRYVDDVVVLPEMEPIQQQSKWKAVRARLFPTGFRTEGAALLRIALPVFATNAMLFLLPFESIMLCGHLTKDELDGVSLANSIINALGLGIGLGLCTACDTLFSQTYGSANKQRMGMYLQRSIMAMSMMPFIIWVFHINILPVFIWLGQIREVSIIAAEYMLYFTPGLMFNFQFLILARYMQNQDKVLPPLIVGAIGNLFNVVSQYICLYVVGLDYRASAVCQALAFLVMWIAEAVYILVSRMYVDTWAGWDKESMFDWWDFFKLALPGVGTVTLETMCFEIGTFISGYLGKDELGAQTVLFQVESLVFQIAFGLSISCNIRVGQHLGADEPLRAMTTFRCGLCFMLISASITATIFATARNYIPYIFTNDQAVVDIASSILPILGIFQFIDGIGAVSSGTMRGCGRQALGAGLIFVGYYVFGIPTGISLALTTPLSIFGLWLGILIGLCVTVPSYLVVLFRQSWEYQAQLAQERVRAKSIGGYKDASSLVSDETLSLLIKNDRPRHRRTVSMPFGCSIDRTNLKQRQFIQADEFLATVRKRLISFILVFIFFIAGVLVRVYVPTEAYMPQETPMSNATYSL